MSRFSKNDSSLLHIFPYVVLFTTGVFINFYSKGIVETLYIMQLISNDYVDFWIGYLRIVSVVFLFLGVGLFLFRYLKHGISFGWLIDLVFCSVRKSSINRRYEDELMEIKGQIDKIENISVIRSDEILVSGDERKDLVNAIVGRIEDESVDEIAKLAEKRLLDKLASESNEQVFKSFNSSLSRLTDEVNSLTRRGSVNLVIGILTTSAGFILFWSMVSAGQPNLENMTSIDYLLSQFLPRLSLVILIEIFAYFFLGLYRSSLNEIKYFQNEITNIEAKYLSLDQSLRLGDKDLLKPILEQLCKTERNFLLKSGESTVYLENEKISQEQQKALVGIFSKALGSVQNRLTDQSNQQP